MDYTIALFFCTIFVLFMQIGFASLESGLNSKRNAVNILFKNLMDLCVGGILFFLIGFQLLYSAYAGTGFSFLGDVIPIVGGVGVTGQEMINPKTVGLNNYGLWFFQLAFAATAATIVSGAVAGRMKFIAYLIYSSMLTGIIYPISAMWVWGNGWLADLGFHDFAGSIVVHSVGGTAGLIGAAMIGPRMDKSFEPLTPSAKGHNYVYAAIGVFVLWVGWYGFNVGTAFTKKDPNIETAMKIAVNTTLAPMAGAITALIIGKFWRKNFDLAITLNGALAGLVSITAACNLVQPGQALLIGAIGALFMIGATILLEVLRVDDPVGAAPVHGACGFWGGLSVAVFGYGNFGVQLLGAVVIPLWTLVCIGGIFWILKSQGLLRVSPEAELEGLDLHEHNVRAYPEDLL